MSNGSSSTDTRFQSLYPSPFFRIADTFQSPTVKELFRWCKYFYLTDGTIQTVVSKLSQYPITRLIYEDVDEYSKVYENIFEKKLDVNTSLVTIGTDYFTYGNCYVSIRPPMKRMAKCNKCKKTQEINSFHRIQVRYMKRGGLMWTALCSECGLRGSIKVSDYNSKDSDEFKLIFWDPLLIDVNHNSISGRDKYIYSIPDSIKKDISENNQEALYDTPLPFITAILSTESHGRIVLSKSSLFHFKRPSLTTDDANRGYGLPLILPAMKLIYYINVLRRHQEAIAHEHITPLRVLHPVGQQGMNPYQHVNLPAWQTKIKDQVKKWRQDPNEFLITSVPIGLTNVGGDARGLFVTPEIQFVRRQIISSMDVPIEFIDGGLQWSGSSISIRILENQFISYRTRVQRFIDWLVDQVSGLKGIKKISVRLADFKAADDVSRRQVLVNLNREGKLSNKSLFDDLGMDYEEEKKVIHEENVEIANHQTEIMKIQSQAQSEAAVSQQIAAMELQKEMQKKMSPEPETIEKVLKLFNVLEPETLRKILLDMQRKNEALYTAIYAKLFGQEEGKPKQEKETKPVLAPPQVQGALVQNPQQKQLTNQLPTAKPPRRKDSPV